ncbi:hypothetical protein KEM56_004314 [Ascosphaera pollenicola]|nr:hypothetical protein KEM56_004314 [Ascosphaera pollenicola]
MNRFSATTAIALTFLISSVFHELVMANMSKKIRGYGFVLQMSQVPLSFIQKTKWVKKQRGLNNVIFWFSIICGTSLIAEPPLTASSVTVCRVQRQATGLSPGVQDIDDRLLSP